MSSSLFIREPNELSPQQRAFVQVLMSYIRERVSYITQSDEQKLYEEIAVSVLKYDQTRTDTIDELFRKYSDLVMTTPRPPWMLEFKLSDLGAKGALEVAKNL